MTLSSIKARLKAATPGPWTFTGDNNYSGNVVYGDVSDRGGYYLRDSSQYLADDEFIAHSISDIEALVKCVEVMREALKCHCMRWQMSDQTFQAYKCNACVIKLKVDQILGDVK